MSSHNYVVRYDWDAATAANFLRKYGLTGNFQFLVQNNIYRMKYWNVKIYQKESQRF